jgi:hypothetical protein
VSHWIQGEPKPWINYEPVRCDRERRVVRKV